MTGRGSGAAAEPHGSMMQLGFIDKSSAEPHIVPPQTRPKSVTALPCAPCATARIHYPASAIDDSGGPGNNPVVIDSELPCHPTLCSFFKPELSSLKFGASQLVCTG